MSYFNQILGGNIPITVIQSIGGSQHDYMLNKDLLHYQLNKGMTNDLGDYPINGHKIMDSSYSAYVNASLEMDRQKVGSGLITILKTATIQALNISRDNLIKISKMKDKLSKQDSKLIEDTVKKVSVDLAHSIVKIINGLALNKTMKELLLYSMHLTGVTSKSKEDMENFRKHIIMIMELPHNFKTHKEIDVLNSLKLKLTPENLKKCEIGLNKDCFFDDEFLFKFASALMFALEHVLGSIMNAAKHDKVCEFYAFSVELANQLSKITYVKPEVVENFLNAGNSTKLTDSTKIKDLKNINKNIDQSKAITGMSKLISDVINDVISKNSAELMRTIAVSNKIAISGAKGSSFSFKKITQSITAETSVQADFAQKVSTKIQNEIANKIKDNIETATKQFDKDVKKAVTDEKESTSYEGVVGNVVGALAGVGNKALDTVGKILSLSVGNSMEQTTSKDISQEMKDTFNLNQGFKYEKNDEAKTAISNVLKTENLSKCASESKMANEIDLGKIDVSGPIDISDVKQEAVVKDVMKCAFNQQVMNEISSKVINDFDKLIKSMIENVNDKLTDEQKTKVQGDIYAIGTAGAAILEGTGKAIESTGKGISIASEGLGKGIESTGKGISVAAEGVGAGIGSILSGLTGPLIIGAVILALLLIGYYMYNRYGLPTRR